MQRFILRNKNQIALISGILIAAAFISRGTLDSLELFRWALITSLGFGDRADCDSGLPGVRVKVVSIDVLAPSLLPGRFDSKF